MRGRIQRVNGMLLQCRLPQARIGDLCQVEKKPGDYMLAEIIGFDQQDAVLSALGDLEGVRVGAAVERLGVPHRVRVSDELLGQVLDGFGRPIAGEGPSAFVERIRPTRPRCCARRHCPRSARASVARWPPACARSMAC